MTGRRASMLGLALLGLLAACGKKDDKADHPVAEKPAAATEHAEHAAPAAAQGHEGHAAAAAPSTAPLFSAPPDGPVQAEMRLLLDALHTAVTAVALDRLGDIPPAIHRVHEAKMKTGQAIESGAWKPRLHPERLEAFKALDEAFHAELEAMVEGAGAGDHVKTTAALGRVLASCQGCHTEYRPPADAK